MDPRAGLQPGFSAFAQRARAGERLAVVFFGASLTWGANASDPSRQSYRAHLARRLEAAYPLARFAFHDAAIGGTGSHLAVFRCERDVLAHRPDLVLIDFTLNDDLCGDDAGRLAAYESLVRRCIAAGAAVAVMIFPDRETVAAGRVDGLLRRTAHLAIAEAYGCAVGDAVTLMQARLAEGAVDLDALWPLASDATHPGDPGYALYAEAAWDGLAEAIARRRACHLPARMLHGDGWLAHRRVRLSGLGPLPTGWTVGAPNRTSAYFDMLMSRWLDDEVIAARDGSAEPAPLRVLVHAAAVLLFGESTPASGRYRVRIDGGAAQEFDAGALGRASGGNAHHAQLLAEGLDPLVAHRLELTPLLAPGQELRIESLCVAGGPATVSRDR